VGYKTANNAFEMYVHPTGVHLSSVVIGRMGCRLTNCVRYYEMKEELNICTLNEGKTGYVMKLNGKST
jgi:hypothetical protein